METGTSQKPWYRRTKYIILIGAIVALLLFSLAGNLFAPPPSPNQVRLNRTVGYFVHSYNVTTGLISVVPGNNTYFIYSDNFLAALALQRYDAGNSSTTGFYQALEVAMKAYLATLPAGLDQNQYMALNSTKGSFGCSDDYVISWSTDHRPVQGTGSAVVATTANGNDLSCAQKNYADLYFLQALHYHRLGNSTGASYYFNKGAADFNGIGVTDRASNSTLYQTYKLALYLYTSSCLGQASVAGFPAAENVLFKMQDNSTGGFYTGYTSSFSHGSTTVNTETTALAALAMEQIMKPSSSC